MANKQKSGGGARKIGRNKKWCTGYKAGGTDIINKARKFRTHLRRALKQLNKKADRLKRPDDIERNVRLQQSLESQLRLA